METSLLKLRKFSLKNREKKFTTNQNNLTIFARFFFPRRRGDFCLLFILLLLEAAKTKKLEKIIYSSISAKKTFCETSSEFKNQLQPQLRCGSFVLQTTMNFQGLVDSAELFEVNSSWRQLSTVLLALQFFVAWWKSKYSFEFKFMWQNINWPPAAIIVFGSSHMTLF